MTGRKEEARQSTREQVDSDLDWVSRHPDDALRRAYLAIELVKDGRVEDGVTQARRAASLAPADNRVHYNVACALACAGLVEEAIAELREATRNVVRYAVDWALRDPDLASLREHPEFVRMFGRVDAEG